MDPTRRHFLQSSSLLLLATTVPSVARPQQPPAIDPERWPLVQGMTDAVSASFVILHPTQSEFHATAISPSGEKVPLAWIDRFAVPGTSLSTTEILVTGLFPGRDFQLHLTGPDGRVFDRRVFRSLDTSGSRCRFAVVSCMDDSYRDEAVRMWGTLARENPDFVVFLGDTCYADSDNRGRAPGDYGRRYAQTRMTLDWFRHARLIPSIASWDDHDFGLDNADRTFPMRGTTTQLFRKFWGSRFHGVVRRGFGVGSVMEAFGQRFFLMDDRSHRDPAGSLRGRHWGQDQTDWLIAEISRDDRPAWLMNGSQFFGGYLGKESFEGDHAGDFDDVLRRLSRLSAPVCFVAGDVHFSELMEIEPEKLGYRTYEFTSSAMHSLTLPFQQHRARNPRRLTSEWRHNFLMFDSEARGSWKIAARCVLDGNRTSFARNLEIQR